VESAAAGLDGPLARAAADHARYLRELGAGDAPLARRRILLVLRSHERSAELADAALVRSERQAGELLAAAEVSLRPLLGDEVAALLAAELAPPAPPNGSRLEGVIGAQPVAPAQRA
jgi:hypothetical protein